MARLQTEAAPAAAEPTTSWSPAEYRADTAPPPPKLDAAPPFLFMWHRERWGVIAGHVVPLLRKFPIVPGVNGVHEQRDPQGNIHLVTDHAIAQARAVGWRVIPIDVDGPGTSYVRRVTGLPNCYVSRFETVYSGSNQITPDSEAYGAWLAGLVASGKIDACPDYVLERLGGEITAKRDESKGAAATKPKHAAIAKRHAADLEVVEAARENTKAIPVATVQA
jgi:hypothetical protein